MACDSGKPAPLRHSKACAVPPAPRVVHWVYDLIRGGTEGQCARVAMGLARRGLPHRVAVFHRRGFFLEPVEAACGPVHETAIRHLLRPSTVAEVIRLARWMRAHNADVLHAWDADAAIFGLYAARLAGCRLVTSRRDLGQIYPLYKRLWMRCADRAAVRVVANAAAIRDHFIHQGLAERRIALIPNLLDLEEFDALAVQPFGRIGELPRGRRMVVVNRLDPEKHTELLIQALPQVRARVPDAVLVVAGDGPEMQKLRQMAATLGISDAVGFLGDVADVPALLRHCEAGALVPSRNEGLSNTILEYMAAGLPVLATDCGGNRELVADGETGRLLRLIPAATEVADAWCGLLENAGTRAAMGRQARLQVQRRHDPVAVLDAFAQLYASGSERRPPA